MMIRNRFVRAVGYGFALFASALLLSVSIEGVTGMAVVGEAHARVGRPATPVSVAGAARRTTRRRIRRTAVFVATLPAGCQTVVINGATVSQCGGTYYQQSGSQYEVVNVE